MFYKTLKLDKRTSAMVKLNIQKQLDSFTKPEHWNSEGHPTKRTVSSVFSHLPMMWICGNGGKFF